MRLSWLFALLLVACAHPPREIGDVLAAHKQTDRYVQPAETLEPRRWDVGQWVLYKVSTHKRLGYVKHAIVADARCGFWLETTLVMAEYEDRTAFKVCLERELDPAVDVSEQKRLFSGYLSKKSERVTARDLADPKNDDTLTTVAHTLEGFPIFARRGAIDEGRNEMVVAAGQFAGVHHVPAKMWLDGAAYDGILEFHAEVPLGGVIKATAYNDNDEPVFETELLDYGLTGAKTELPDYAEHVKTYGAETD